MNRRSFLAGLLASVAAPPAAAVAYPYRHVVFQIGYGVTWIPLAQAIDLGLPHGLALPDTKMVPVEISPDEVRDRYSRMLADSFRQTKLNIDAEVLRRHL